MSFRKFLRTHKTRIVGYVTTVTGTLMTLIEPLRDLLSRQEIAVIMIVCGLATAICGHLNASQPSEPPAE